MTTFTTPVRDTYQVWGATLREVVDAISQYPEAGAATWSPVYQYQTGADGTIVSATVTVDQQITMPVWADEPNASASARAEWARFWQALEDHEQGHLELVHRHLSGLEDRLVGLTPAEADAVFRAALADLQQASDDYDAATDHGRATGTVVNLDADEAG